MLLIIEEEYEDDHLVEIGKAKILREGSDITIIGFSLVLKYALEAAEELEKIGISAEVIDLRTIRPIDRETIVNSVKKTSRCITVEEGFLFGSVGREISSILMEEAFDYLDAPVSRIGAPFSPVPFSPALESHYIPDAKTILKGVRDVMARR